VSLHAMILLMICDLQAHKTTCSSCKGLHATSKFKVWRLHAVLKVFNIFLVTLIAVEDIVYH
jgi:hypothetical protein